MATTTEIQPELPVSSSTIASASLFDGELYDDELIEIYNIPLGTTVIDSNELQQTTTDLPEVTTQEWSALNMSTTKANEGVIFSKNVPATTSTTTTSGVVGLVEDDFLGAFQPSTSFDRLEAALLASGPNNNINKKNTTNNVPLNSTNYMETSRRVSVVEGVSVNNTPNASVIVRGSVLELVPSTWHNPSPPTAENPLSCETTGIPNPLSGICDSFVHDAIPVPITLQTTTAAIPVITPSTSPAVVLPQELVSVQTSTALPDKASSSSNAMDVSTNATATTTLHKTTEADIASSARGAVLELIRDSTITSRGENPAGIGEGKVDTSTARIKALTGDNWVEATRYVLPNLTKTEASDATTTTSKVSNSNGDNKRQRQHLASPECAKQSTATQHKTTEADIASSAKGAVLNLIRNSSISSRGDNPSRPGEGEVDTSTARIRALTGDNWVEATRYDIPSLAKLETSEATTTPKANDSTKDNKRQRQNLTPQESAKQKARNRNREHARNTRLRKKAYVEELKKTLTQLVAQNDIEETQKGQDAQRLLDQREVRFMVIEEFLKLRGRNEPNYGCWDAILEDDFTFTLPITRYRTMVHANNINQEDDDNSNSTPQSLSSPQKIEQVLSGVPEVMADAQHSASFLLESKTANPPVNTALPPVTFVYHCDRDNMMMDGANVILHWTASSIGAVKHEISRAELSLQGSLRAAFNPVSNKLLSIRLTFDTSSIVSQLKRNFSMNLPSPTKKRKITLSTPCDQITAAVASAHYAARGTDSILEYLHINPSTDYHSAAASVTSSDNSE